jgi:hypothetical protein
MSDKEPNIDPTLKTRAELFGLIVESSMDLAIYTVEGGRH